MKHVLGGQTKYLETYFVHFCTKFYQKNLYDVNNRRLPNGRKHCVGVTADFVGPRAQPGRRELEEDQSRCQFHQCFTRSCCAQVAQKCKKDSQVVSLFTFSESAHADVSVILPTYYEQFFQMKVLCTAFF